LHTPIVRLQQHTIIPFIMQHMLHMVPDSIWQRFCIMAQAAVSVQVQVIFIPPWHFSTLKVQRGAITMFVIMPPAVPGMPPIIGAPIPDIPIGFRSISIALFIIFTPSVNIPASTPAPSETTWRSGYFPDSEKSARFPFRGCFFTSAG